VLRSMTAFGRAELEVEGRSYVCEMRSLNNRYLDVSVRLPRRYNVLEDKIKRLVAARVNRGRVELSVQINGYRGESAPLQRVEANLELARGYQRELERLRQELGIEQPVTLEMLLGLRDVLELKEEEESVDLVWERLSRPVEGALAALDAMRLEEGRTLAADFRERLGLLAGLLSRIEERAPALIEDYRKRLAERIQAAVQAISGEAEVDEMRLIQEIAIFADRTDVTEELVRARSHLDQFRALLEAEEPVGRKLNFLLQELGREVNTIGSKATDAAVAQLVVEAKSELERLREQVQNIE
jgi:uncharacterized protein (TIGR00255 family)